VSTGWKNVLPELTVKVAEPFKVRVEVPFMVLALSNVRPPAVSLASKVIVEPK
jgi:hypothetical protein